MNKSMLKFRFEVSNFCGSAVRKLVTRMEISKLWNISKYAVQLVFGTDLRPIAASICEVLWCFAHFFFRVCSA